MILDRAGKMRGFKRDIILVFLSSSLVNFLNLLYQLFIVRRLSPEDFAAFNSLLSIALLLSVPAVTLIPTVAKYSARFSVHSQHDKIVLMFSGISKWTLALGVLFSGSICFSSPYITRMLKISDKFPILIAALVIFLSWVSAPYSGAIQGLEKFGWLSVASVVSGLLKLTSGVIFVALGFRVAGALGAYVVSITIVLLIYLFPLKGYIFKRAKGRLLESKEIFKYILPVATAAFCFNNLTTFDMVLVKYFFSSADGGFYSVAQIIGKIFLFLPAAISIAMFPKTAGLNARNIDTTIVLKRSLSIGAILCIFSALLYNLFPIFTLRLLTGKDFPVSIALGRFFSFSMSFYALSFLLISYHLSVSDFRFIRYLILFTIAQVIAIALFHRNVFNVQMVLCVNSLCLFLVNLKLGLKEAGLHKR